MRNDQNMARDKDILVLGKWDLVYLELIDELQELTNRKIDEIYTNV